MERIIVNLSDNKLMEAYYTALEIDLDIEFINMLIREIKKRDLMTNIKTLE